MRLMRMRPNRRNSLFVMILPAAASECPSYTAVEQKNGKSDNSNLRHVRTLEEQGIRMKFAAQGRRNSKNSKVSSQGPEKISNLVALRTPL
jgi:hypothetical protein